MAVPAVHGGPLSGRDVLRILTGTKRDQGKPKAAAKAPDGDPSASEKVEKSDIRSGALADDVCRHIWAERGRLAPILYGST